MAIILPFSMLSSLCTGRRNRRAATGGPKAFLKSRNLYYLTFGTIPRVWDGSLFTKLFWLTVRKKCFSDKKKIEIRGGRLRVCKNFENSKRSEQFLKAWIVAIILQFSMLSSLCTGRRRNRRAATVGPKAFLKLRNLYFLTFGTLPTAWDGNLFRKLFLLPVRKKVF